MNDSAENATEYRTRGGRAVRKSSIRPRPLPQTFDRSLTGHAQDHERYRDLHKASHSFHADISSAGIALRMATRPRLVLSEHTGVPEMRITPDSPFHRQLAHPDAPAWASLIAANFRAWFARARPSSHMHDPLTLSAALGQPFVTFQSELLHLDHDALLHRDLRGRHIEVSHDVDYSAAMEWMSETLRL